MKPQVIMGHDDQLCIAVPLFTVSDSEVLCNDDKWVIAFNTQRPVGYALDFGNDNLTLVNAKIVEERCEFLGDL